MRHLILVALLVLASCSAADVDDTSVAEQSLTTTRALHIHVSGPQTAPDHETVTVGCTIFVGFSDDDQLQDSLTPELELKTGLGIYKTEIQLNADIAAAVKAYLYSSQSIPTNGYAATYVSGAYGALTIL
jgi:hypothetical protein